MRMLKLMAIFAMLLGSMLYGGNIGKKTIFLPLSQLDGGISYVIEAKGCDKVLNYPSQVRCYNYTYKRPLFNAYVIDRNVSKGNIKKRGTFVQDPNIPDRVQNKLSCYRGAHIDRGHLAPDADYDYSIKMRDTTYIMSNVVPQPHYVNAKLIGSIETYERKLAMKYGHVIVIAGAAGSKGHLRHKSRCTVIPRIYYKVLFVKRKDRYKFMTAYVVKQDHNYKWHVIKYKSLYKFNSYLKRYGVMVVRNHKR